jgi:hypothetical protein
MADTVTYAIEAPNGQTYKIEGPAGATQEQVQAEVLKQHPDATKPPSKEQMRGNIISSDVPTVVGERPNPPPIEQKRGMKDYLKALYEVPATVGSAALAQPIGQAYGVIKSIPEAIQTGQAPAPIGQRIAEETTQKLQYSPESPVTQDVMQSVGGALETAKIPPYIGKVGIGEIPSMSAALRGAKPFVQEAVRPAVEAVQPMAQALRRKPSIIDLAPTGEALAEKSSNLFKSAKESGVELNAQDFSQNMARIGKDLRNEGYDPRLYPKLAVAIDEMTQAGIPKDFNELSTLRKFIQNAQKSADPDERRLATSLKSDFDSYVANIPESSVVGGNKQGLADWKDARDTYAKLSKAEVFNEMLEKAKLDKTKFTQSGEENSLAMQLRKLAENPKRMRLFTEAEQDAIKEAAKGGTTQNILRFFGKFTPTGAVSGIAGGLLIGHNPAVGIPLEAAAIASRYAATKIRKNDVSKLAALMRAGTPIVKEKE